VAARRGAHLRRTDVRAVAQEHASNTEAFSSQPAASETPARSGGPRAGRAAGVSVGRPRCRRIRSITAASWIRARWKTTVEPSCFPTGSYGRSTRKRGDGSRFTGPERDQAQTATAPGTRQDVTPTRACQQRRPTLAAGVAPRRLGGVCLTSRLGGRVLHACLATIPGRLAPHHLNPPGRPRPQHAVVQDQVDARAWHEHRQSPQKLDGVEHDVRRPVAPRLPELEPHLSLVGQMDPLLGHGRTQHIATHALEPLPLPSRYDKARVQIEAVRPRMTASLFG
jgi:hypothetical protein